jgi:hypothetical protein
MMLEIGELSLFCRLQRDDLMGCHLLALPEEHSLHEPNTNSSELLAQRCSLRLVEGYFLALFVLENDEIHLYSVDGISL